MRYFGVSNQTPRYMDLFKKFVTQPFVVNQLELNLIHSEMIEDLLYANRTDRPDTAASGTLDYCRLHDILIQAWAPSRGRQVV